MFAALLKLVPALRCPTLFAVQDISHEQFAIDSCMYAVKTYFPCDTSTSATNHTCLCEQYLWRISCFDNHAERPLSHPDRAKAEIKLNNNCRAAGSIGAELVQRRYHVERRQIGSVLSSLASDASSILSSASVTIPTSAITAAVISVVHSIAPPTDSASVTSAGAALSSALDPLISSAARNTASPTSTNPRSTSQASATSAASSSPSSSKPSTGVIVGAVVGGIAALALIGILIMLILRHRRKKTAAITPKDNEASPTMSYTAPYSERNPSIIRSEPESSGGDTLVPHNYHSMQNYQNEKIAYHMEVPQPNQHEMGTSANVWEIDSREVQSPTELESPITEHPPAAHFGNRLESQRTYTPVSPITEDPPTSSFASRLESPRTYTPYRPVRPDAESHGRGKEEYLGSQPIGHAL